MGGAVSGAGDFTQNVGEEAGRSAARHVYVHVPFCARRCSYCDFAIAVRRVVPARAFVEALRAEIAARVRTTAVTALDTLYLGGGTPSRLGGEGVARTLEAVRAEWPVAPGAEVTLEANPEDVDRDAVEAWRHAGVTRVSLGVQSFDDAVLRWMHRAHDADRVSRAVRALHAGGIEDWSLDLIYALPAEVPRNWRRDLEEAARLAPPHISAYGLTIEPKTPVMRWQERGLLREADEGRYETEFLAAHEFLRAEGYEHYEVSNFARPGRRARHNSAYWHRVPYVGLGPSAHGFDGTRRRWNEREFVAWVRRASAGEDPVSGSEEITAEQAATEEIYLGLRSFIGVAVSEQDQRQVNQWVARGWATHSLGRAYLTPSGWLRMDALTRALTDSRSR